MKLLSLTRFSSSAFFVVIAGVMAMLAAYTTAQQTEPAQLGKLGTVDFPISGSAQAQDYLKQASAR